MLFDAVEMGTGWATCVAAGALTVGLCAATAPACAQADVTSTSTTTAGAPATEVPLDTHALDHELPPGDALPARVEALRSTHPSKPPSSYGRQDPLLRDVRLDGHVALTWDGAFGVGVRADWLLIAGTFKYSARDELAISAGCDITFISFDGSQVVEAFPTAVLQWSIGVDDRLFFYPELGLLGHVDDGRWDGLYPNIGFGARYYLARSIGLHGRFGWPIAFSAGAVF